MKKLLSGPMRWVRRHWRLSLVVLVLVAGAVISLLSHGHNKNLPPKKQSEVITYSTDTPSEKKPDKNFTWTGRPADPKYITLPTINSGGYIQKVGVDQHQAVAVPNNIYMGGWFSQTVLPGAPGLSVIDGHVNGRVADAGIFKNLSKLKKGDQLSVEFGDSHKRSFVIEKVVSVKTAAAPSVLFSQEPGITSQLNLITCGGSYVRTEHQYNQRVIAVAKAM
jgi:LPXTG-site transpeptidase (sortase) family protein